MVLYLKHYFVFSLTFINYLASPLNTQYWQKDNGLAEKRLSVVFSGNDWIDNIYIFRCVVGDLQWAVASNSIASRSYQETEW